MTKHLTATLLLVASTAAAQPQYHGSCLIRDDAHGRITTYSYVNGRLMREVGARTTSWRYNPDGSLGLITTDYDQRYFSYEDGRVSRIETKREDEDANMVVFATETFEYDADGRMSASHRQNIEGDDVDARYRWSGDQLVGATWQRGSDRPNRQRFTWDSEGRLASIRSGSRVVEAYTYGRGGFLQAITLGADPATDPRYELFADEYGRRIGERYFHLNQTRVYRVETIEYEGVFAPRAVCGRFPQLPPGFPPHQISSSWLRSAR